MFKHILIATDGSELAAKAVTTGLELAKALGAKVTLVSVTEPRTHFVPVSLPPVLTEDEAKARNCDVIVMASHGRRGLARLVLGGETVRVVTHSAIPVLVCR